MAHNLSGETDMDHLLISEVYYQKNQKLFFLNKKLNDFNLKIVKPKDYLVCLL
jgi:hypothetical protein